ncbi:MAG TPA: hypothetical protein VMI75_30580 [Polyangiaceae bacterium]|nr:hypothetical protein [Polyangiaceae bacterium]
MLLSATACGGEVAEIGATLPAGDGGEVEASAGPSTSICPLVPASDPGTLQGCSLVGTWTFSSWHGSVSSTGVVLIDPEGGYYGGPTGTDLTQTYAFDGAYAVDDGAHDAGGPTFHLLHSCGDGTCSGEGVFQVQFRSGCDVVELTELVTACTGDRTAIAGHLVLTVR